MIKPIIQNIKPTQIGKLFFLILLASELLASGQEYIREFPNLDGQSSIIRDVDIKHVLISSNEGEVVVFTMFDQVQQTATSMKFSLGSAQKSRINDFVIYKDTVYFAATRTIFDEEDSVNLYASYFGYFPLAGFPNSPLATVGIHCDLTKSIGVYSEKTEPSNTHVVMATYDKYSGNGWILDAFQNSDTTWETCYARPESNKYVDDIAISDNYVAITTRKPELIGDSTRLWLFYIPYGGHSIFDDPAYYNGYYTPRYIRTLLVEKCAQDTLATTYADINGNLYVKVFNGPVHLSNIIMPNLPFWYFPDDIKYNSQRNSVDILCNYMNAQPILPPFRAPMDSKIYVFYTSNHTGTAPVECRTFEDHVLWSLDYRKQNPNDFAGCGASEEFPQLKVYNYTEPYYKYCSIKTILECTINDNTKPYDKYQLNPECFIYKIEYKDTWEEEQQIEKPCN